MNRIPIIFYVSFYELYLFTLQFSVKFYACKINFMKVIFVI